MVWDALGAQWAWESHQHVACAGSKGLDDYLAMELVVWFKQKFFTWVSWHAGLLRCVRAAVLSGHCV